MTSPVILNNPPIQKTITSTTTNYDVFSDEKIAMELAKYNNLTSDKIKENSISMKVVFLPDSPCTVIVNNREYDAPNFYSTNEVTVIKNFTIKEKDIKGLLILTIN